MVKVEKIRTQDLLAAKRQSHQNNQSGRKTKDGKKKKRERDLTAFKLRVPNDIA